jgi:uncharacterized lipoprotein YmbA
MIQSHKRHNISPLFLLITMLMFNGCSTTPPSKFYTLEAMSGSETIQIAPARRINLHIGIGPVQFAEYLQRSQIVTRTSGAEINLAETHRWAEPLHNNFGRILAENLSILVGTDKISLHPSRNWSDIDYQVVVNVWQFDVSEQGEVILVANWSIRGKGGSELLTMKKSAFSTNLGSTTSYTDIVLALSKTVELLSREIAAALEAEQDQ